LENLRELGERHVQMEESLTEWMRGREGFAKPKRTRGREMFKWKKV